MTQFAEFQKPPQDPSYIGVSKEFNVDKPPSGIAGAIGDVGKLAINAVGAVDELNKDTVDKELLSGINQRRQADIQTGLDLLSGTPAPTPANADGSPDVPMAINHGLRRAAHITQATKMGRMGDELYYADMQGIAQNLTSRYPGYERYINDRMSHWLGTNPANAQRAAILDTLKKENAEDTPARRNLTELHGDQKYFLSADGSFNQAQWNAAYQAAATNDPQGMANFRTFVAKQKVFEHRQTLEKQGLDLENTQGNVTEDRALKSYRTRASDAVQGHLDRYNFQLGNNSYTVKDINAIIGQIVDKDGGVIDKDALSRLGLSVSQLHNTIDQDLRRMERDPAILNNVKDRAKLQAVRTDLLGQLDDLKKHVGEKNLHLFSSDLNTLSGIEERNAVQAVRTDADTLRWNTYNKLFSGQVANSLINEENSKSGYQMQGRVSKAIANATMKDVLSGGNLDLNMALDRYRKGTGATPTTPQQIAEQSAFLNQQITWAQTIITSPTALPEHKERAARYIASGGSTQFINTLPPKEQIEAWSRIAAPPIAAATKQNVSPSEWRNYRTWAQSTFKGLMANQVDQINRGVDAASGLTFELDANNNIVPKSTREGRLGNRLGPNGMPAGLSRDTIKAISDINLGLDTYSNILKLDGRKLDERELEALGLKLTKPPAAPSTPTGSKNKRTTEAPNGPEPLPSVSFITPANAQSGGTPPPSDVVREGFRGLRNMEDNNPSRFIHDDAGVRQQLQTEGQRRLEQEQGVIPSGARPTQGTPPTFNSEQIDQLYTKFQERGAGRADLNDLIRSAIHMYTGEDPGEQTFPPASQSVGQPQPKGRRQGFPQPRR